MAADQGTKGASTGDYGFGATAGQCRSSCQDSWEAWEHCAATMLPHPLLYKVGTNAVDGHGIKGATLADYGIIATARAYGGIVPDLVSNAGSQFCREASLDTAINLTMMAT